MLSRGETDVVRPRAPGNERIGRLPPMDTRTAACLFLAAVVGCSKYANLETKRLSAVAPREIDLITVDRTPERWDLAILADPQLHNFLGGPIRSMSPGAARSLTRVARRPAVLNVLGRLILETFVARLDARVETTRDPLLLLLGDAANVSCTNEFDGFIAAMNRRSAGAWLAVHGNHDSYMSGNLSVYHRPTAWPNQDGWPADRSILPRETRWSPAEAAGFAYPKTEKFGRATSWAQACADPCDESAPMTKGVWLRRYLMALERQGIALKRAEDVGAAGTIEARATPDERGETPFNVDNCRPPFRFDGAGAEDSALGRKNFHLSGVWRPRAQVQGRAWTESDVARCGTLRPPSVEEAQEWASFVVQSFDIGTSTRVILIDTAIRENVVSGGDYGVRPGFPGTKAFLGKAQIAHIDAHVRQAAGREIVFAGHHPLKDFYSDDLKALLDHDPVLYLSGHTHFESSLILHGNAPSALPELNIASLTDWPMEAALLSLDPGRVLWKIVGLHGPGEGSAGCGGTTEKSFYEPLVPELANVDCSSRVDERDLKTRYKWREHQVERSERALEWLGAGWKPPFASSAASADLRARASDVKRTVEDMVLGPSREHEEQRLRGLEFAVCASRAVAEGWRAPVESTCPRRSGQVRPAASVAGFEYRWVSP